MYDATIRQAFPAVDLFEYQGKQLFARYDIPVSSGAPVDTVGEAVEVADRIGYPVVVKAQVQVGGRGKAGGIKLATTADEVREHAGNILGMDIKGHTVEVLWIERASDIAEEYYASFTLDRGAKLHLGMLSAQGGVEIEQVAAGFNFADSTHARQLAAFRPSTGSTSIRASASGLSTATCSISTPPWALNIPRYFLAARSRVNDA